MTAMIILTMCLAAIGGLSLMAMVLGFLLDLDSGNDRLFVLGFAGWWVTVVLTAVSWAIYGLLRAL